MEKIHCIILVDDDLHSKFLLQSITPFLYSQNSPKVLTNAKEALSYLQSECKGKSISEIVMLDIKTINVDMVDFVTALECLISENKDRVKVVVISRALVPKKVTRPAECKIQDFFTNQSIILLLLKCLIFIRIRNKKTARQIDTDSTNL